MTEREREAKRLDDIIVSLPDGYLRDMLVHLAPQFVADMANDLPTLPNLAAMGAKAHDLQKDIDELDKRWRSANEAVQTVERHKEYAEEQLARIRRNLHRAANAVRSLQEAMGELTDAADRALQQVQVAG